jgi:ABC-type multidrug transport system permease subunit
MFCQQCGAQIDDKALFCNNCGTRTNNVQQPVQQQPVQQPVYQQPMQQPYVQQPVQQQPVYQQPVYQQPVYQQPVYQQENVVDPIAKEMADKAAGSALTFGILSLVFACTFYLSFLGIIFACIAFSKANKNKMFNNGVLQAKAKVGRGLAIGGLVAGIVFTFFLMIFVLTMMAVIGEAVEHNNDFYEYSLFLMSKFF